MFIDEAQDLIPSVFDSAFELAERISCGADNAQNLQGKFPPDAAIDIIFEKLNAQKKTIIQPLQRNYRNTREIFEFARRFVPDDEHVQSIDTSRLPNGENPEIISDQNDELQLKYILTIIENNKASNIGILVNYRNQIIRIKEYLEANGYSCNNTTDEDKSFSYYYNGMPWTDEKILFDKMRTPFILTYDSCKGLEFDIVILPFFNVADEALSNRRYQKNRDGSRSPETNADGTAKMWATRNHYYVAATRARTLLYILCLKIPNILR